MDRDSSLLPVWVIGFTGHRFLDHPEKVANVLHDLIASLKTTIPGELVAYSSVAIGADTLFVETCLSFDIPFTAVLPRPEQDFRSDFSDPDWERTAGLLRKATRVESLPAARDRDLAYLECGLTTVEQADVMIAVWDGQASRGTGGTAEVVAHVRTLGKPLIIIEPKSLEIERERLTPECFTDPDMEYFNQIPVRIQSTPRGSSPTERRVYQFFQKVDAHASHIAPRVRMWIGASVIMNSVAAILTASEITFGFQSLILNVLIFGLVSASMVSVGLIQFKKAHHKWLRCRAAAEICRSALSTWGLEDVSMPFWFGQLDGFARLTKSIHLMHVHDRDKKPADLEQWRRNYLTVRVDEQLNYFRGRRRKLRVGLIIYTFAFWLFSVLAVVRMLFSLLFKDPFGGLFSLTVHSFLPIAFPLAAGCALSLIAIFDLSRQVARSKAIEVLLQKLRAQIERCENLPSLRHAVEHSENAFAAEVFEWFTLFKYPRFS